MPTDNQSLVSTCRSESRMKKLSNILVIEDEASIQKLAKVNLTASGFRVLVAGNGKDALKLAQTEHPDLILLDLMLPDMSGWDILMTIRTSKELRETPVVIMTAVARDGGQHLVRHMKADGYLIKPFDVDELLDQVKRLL